jgi:hypothetical protein
MPGKEVVVVNTDHGTTTTEELMKLYSSGINPSSSSGTNVASSLIVIHVFLLFVFVNFVCYITITLNIANVILYLMLLIFFFK